MTRLILLDIFSYSCMNCLRSLDFIKRINNKYKKYGLKTILIHPPEWEFEKNSENILRAAKQYCIKIPIIIDKDKKIIKKLKISFWPTQILIKNNRTIYKHIGEGNYKALENKITKLLNVKTKKIFEKEPKYSKFPMIYAGKRGEKLGIIYKRGKWTRNESLTGRGSLTIKTKGKITNFTAQSMDKKSVNVNIKVNNKLVKKLKVNKPQLYQIIRLQNPKTLTLTTKEKIKIYSFSFR